MHRKQCEQVGELFVACSGCGVLRNGKTSQFGSEAKDSRARDQGTTLLRGPRSLFWARRAEWTHESHFWKCQMWQQFSTSDA